MPSSMFDQWSQPHRASFGPVVASITELNRITTQACGELFRQNLKAMTLLAQSSQEQLQDLSQVKGIDGALQLQKQWLEKATPQVLKHAEEVLDTVLESATEYQAWMENNMDIIRQQGKAVSDKFPQKDKDKN
jgi:hypothetical protein